MPQPCDTTLTRVTQARQELSEAAAAAAQEAAHKDPDGHQNISTGRLEDVREQARSALAALRSLAKLALHSSAAMQAAATSLETASRAPSAQVSHVCPCVCVSVCQCSGITLQQDISKTLKNPSM